MNELKLIKQCKNGNKESFNELIRFYYPFVSKFLLKITNNTDLTEDLVQETFIKLIRNIEKYDTKGNASFSTYLITIAKNNYIDYIRKNKKELQEIDMDIIKDEFNYEDEYFKKESEQELLRKIKELPISQQEAIKLKYFEGYTLNEIAKIQKVEIKTIKSRLFEARKKLKEKLKGSDIYE